MISEQVETIQDFRAYIDRQRVLTVSPIRFPYCVALAADRVDLVSHFEALPHLKVLHMAVYRLPRFPTGSHQMTCKNTETAIRQRS